MTVQRKHVLAAGVAVVAAVAVAVGTGLGFADTTVAPWVSVTGPSGSCVLLNSSAMDAIREPGKNLVRRNTVELVH
ncbi:hypothetical protein QTQ03_24515 [Micromonospora sp. WMMA1363]|uniref:hypothetical protein n=1 Tax=Micromonospora sp. WMMA1363 TaxID=3053985 RepID=UPI00259C728A|nr:hypothetical protein [Micromonospora sp. WMMA1363]MDM4722602.1 hypothetical protein [Micromonospora sp. WMMA1363]